MRSRIYAEAMRTLSRYRLRSFLMMLGVIVGVTALTLLLTIAEGTEKKVMGEIEKMFTANNIIVRAGSGKIMGGEHSGGPTTSLTIDDMEAITAEIETIDQWDALQMINGREVTYRGASEEVRIFGNTPSAERLGGRSVSRGQFFDAEDMEMASRVALLGSITATSLFGDEDPIGEQIRIGGVPFRVIGLLEDRGTDLHGMNRDDEIYIPLSTLQRRLMNVDHVVFGKVHVPDPDQIEATAARLTEILRRRHSIGTNESDDFSLITPFEVRKMVARSNRVFNLVLPLVAGLALLVAAVVIANLMLLSVNERRREIGLKLAVGARVADIVAQFFVETLLVTLAGGGLGVLLGLMGASWLGGHLELPRVLSGSAVAMGVGASVLVGLVAALLPARRAAAVDPIVTLR